MEEAIKLANNNGWYAKPNSAVVMTGAFVLEPNFWQALGKAKNFKVDDRRCYCNDYSYNCQCDFFWQTWASEYFDLLMTGGDTEKFWKELIKAK